jgi:hypothetical protein
MSASKFRAGTPVSRRMRAAIAVALLVPALERETLAQTNDDRGGFAVRELSLSTGYASLQLPPITLGGYLPNDILNADLITSGAVEIDWRRVTPRTMYVLDLLGMYTARTRYSQLSAPGANLTFGMSRTLGNRWRLGAAAADSIANSDQLAFQPTQAGRLVEGAGSFDDLAGTVALARSPSPDLNQAVLFVPISQSLVGSDLYGNRIMATSVRADATYAHSERLATHFRANYTTVRRISSSKEPGQVLLFPDSTAENAGVDVRYGRSERSQLTAALDWSQASGAFTDEAVLAKVGYGWSGRKWFSATTVGAALRPFKTPLAVEPLTTIRNRTPAIVYGALIGYKFRTQTLLVQYSRASHDEYGHGGRNIATGFEGNVQSAVGSWSWSAPGGHWMAQSDFSMLRGPGNFSYIYTWLSTIGIGRQLGPNVRLMGELLFDRHGSRGFEGFHLTRAGSRLNLVWTPRRRPVG